MVGNRLRSPTILILLVTPASPGLGHHFLPSRLPPFLYALLPLIFHRPILLFILVFARFCAPIPAQRVVHFVLLPAFPVIICTLLNHYLPSHPQSLLFITALHYQLTIFPYTAYPYPAPPLHLTTFSVISHVKPDSFCHVICGASVLVPSFPTRSVAGDTTLSPVLPWCISRHAWPFAFL